MKQILARSYCFPIGWIAARLADGQWKIAIINAVGILALLGALHLVEVLEDRRPT